MPVLRISFNYDILRCKDNKKYIIKQEKREKKTHLQ
jgi:hypothetical protein